VPVGLGLAPAERVRRRPDFERAYGAGFRIHARYMTLFIVENGGFVPRVGIAATRKLGPSVQRNRAKRLAREVFRRHKIESGLDIIIVPRREMLDAPFASLEIDYTDALKRRHRSADSSKRPLGRRGGSGRPARI